ncbi:MAG: ABC-type transport auxiliary lipoprotein family protein [Parvibaculum sp.]|uniref:ABC-type transport auxiliary lipoprotein family protein n=1 Tax=Parvibaculum sp. TaxID=2024848 RepID=UPI0025E1CC6D|nr:ABC-type transport auxiliary lipoprotein family protein [Parvibaculum sp.]MCE9650744.1 ABC-type transport auxiliary lipoprotein family protein [Parvibaculum sp.]
MKMHLARLGIVFLLGGSLGGCALANVASEPAPQLFMLTAGHPASGGAEAGGAAARILVDDFTASAAIDTARIVFQPNPNEIKYYADARWADRAPAMIQSLMIETLQNSGRFASVAARGSEIRGDLAVKGDIRQFAAEANGEATNVHVDFFVRLVRLEDRDIVASRDFNAVVPVTGSGIAAVVAAHDAALRQTLSEIMLWTLAETSKPARDTAPVSASRKKKK